MNSYNEATSPSSQSSLLFWLITLLLLLSSICGWYFYMQADDKLKKSQQQKQRVQKHYAQKSDELYELWDKIQNYQTKNYQLNAQLKACKDKKCSAQAPVQEKKPLQQQAVSSKVENDALNQLKAKLIDSIEADNISIKRQKHGTIVININNDLIFRSKQVNIIKSGTEILLKVAVLLQQFPNRKIQIIGHTDNLPLRSGSYEYILSNWELSAFRAGAVIRYLQHAAKVEPQRMMLLGASRYQPLEKGNSNSIRAKNRRLEIRLLAGGNNQQ